MRGPLPPDEQARLLVEVWKHTVSVQQHFNDICWRIRGLALTALTFALGGAALAARQPVELGGWLQLSSVIALGGLVLWSAFSYLDQRYYHRLLKGAVDQGRAVEKELAQLLPAVRLTEAISAASATPALPLLRLPWSRGFRPPKPNAPAPRSRREIHSTEKLANFYGAVKYLLFLAAVVLQFGAADTRAQPPQSVIIVTPSPSASPAD
jgi:hypothetical protein